MTNPHQYKIALSLSAFVLPGLGQVHLKERSKGWTMMLLCFIDIIFLFGKYMMALLVVNEKYYKQKSPLKHIGHQLWEGALLQKEWLIGGALFLLAVWIWSVLDVWQSSRKACK